MNVNKFFFVRFDDFLSWIPIIQIENIVLALFIMFTF